ncbi:hypothetical protein QE392_001249 [Microbacterium proteolyticum]|nr:hypothetical protein [Microbacterium sp. SORGH_AS_0344]MDQ1169445.1 hypothetical protein [Microbacterium proteolyticum]
MTPRVPRGELGGEPGGWGDGGGPGALHVAPGPHTHTTHRQHHPARRRWPRGAARDPGATHAHDPPAAPRAQRVAPGRCACPRGHTRTRPTGSTTPRSGVETQRPRQEGVGGLLRGRPRPGWTARDATTRRARGVRRCGIHPAADPGADACRCHAAPRESPTCVARGALKATESGDSRGRRRSAGSNVGVWESLVRCGRRTEPSRVRGQFLSLRGGQSDNSRPLTRMSAVRTPADLLRAARDALAGGRRIRRRVRGRIPSPRRGQSDNS